MKTVKGRSVGCPFCEKDLSKSIFFSGEGWFAFLDSNPILNGHTILARDRSGSCPDSMTEETLRGIDMVLAKVAEALKAAYSAKHILVGSLRGSVRHMHFHLIPVSDAEEKRWRAASNWEKGHLFQFLGDQEREAFLRHQKERIEMGWSESEQRAHIVASMQNQVSILKALLVAE